MSKNQKSPDTIQGEPIKPDAGELFDFRKRAERDAALPKERKLPPVPGRAPNPNCVPEDEVLPRK
jgi:hypothetical protein